MDEDYINKFLAAISINDIELAAKLLKETPTLALAKGSTAKHYESPINHWFYVGDTGLHMAAAGYLIEIANLLLENGADPNSYGNHRNSGPLHYASDGYVVGQNWNERNQLAMISRLLNAGANIHAVGKNGATPFAPDVRRR